MYSLAISLVFTRIMQIITFSPGLLYSLIVFKYVNLKNILGRIGLYYWWFGEKLNYFRDLWSKGKYFQEPEEFFSGIW